MIFKSWTGQSFQSLAINRFKNWNQMINLPMGQHRHITCQHACKRQLRARDIKRIAIALIGEVLCFLGVHCLKTGTGLFWTSGSVRACSARNPITRVNLSKLMWQMLWMVSSWVINLGNMHHTVGQLFCHYVPVASDSSIFCCCVLQTSC